MGADQSSQHSKEKITEIKTWINSEISNNLVVVFSKTTCPFCRKAKNALQKVGLEKYILHELDKRDDCEVIMDALRDLTGARTVPRVFINGKCVGGGSEVDALEKNGQLKLMLEQCGAI